MEREYALTVNGVSFREGWEADSKQNVVVFKREGHQYSNFAVRIKESENGPKLELLTKQADEKGRMDWRSSETPYEGKPERVIQEVEYRQARIGKSWRLDADAKVLTHKDGIFAARSVLDGNGLETGKLELLTKQGTEGNKEWKPAKNPYVGSPEQVFRVATTRQWKLDEIKAARLMPDQYVLGKDSEGKEIFKHSGNRHAVRIYAKAEDGKSAKLEILTTQFNPEKKKFEWRPSKKPFIGTPMEVYKEIRNREFGIAKGKEEQERKQQGVSQEPQAELKKEQRQTRKPAAPKKEQTAKKAPAPKKGRGM